MELTNEQIANSFKIRCSALYDICAGEIGLTEKQAETLAKHEKRFDDSKTGKQKPLTDNMVAEMKALQIKRDNPELPQGAKTYCKNWLKEFLYRRRTEIKSKYLDKGNLCEEDGFTIMCLELNLGMVYKNTKYFENEYLCGTPDLILKKVYDNKCSYSLDTFPMFEKECPDDKYEWQLNGYGDLTGKDGLVLAYTLIDAPKEIIEREIKWLSDPNDVYRKIMNLVYTKDTFVAYVSEFCPAATDTSFIEIPQKERIKHFEFTKDQNKITTAYERVKMCRRYILTLLNN